MTIDIEERKGSERGDDDNTMTMDIDERNGSGIADDDNAMNSTKADSEEDRLSKENQHGICDSGIIYIYY